MTALFSLIDLAFPARALSVPAQPALCLFYPSQAVYRQRTDPDGL